MSEDTGHTKVATRLVDLVGVAIDAYRVLERMPLDPPDAKVREALGEALNAVLVEG